ncbi:bifunctional riboflavin kinase/FAD synthetase [Gulosibacter sp. ACHW.36C]|uniref:Riboflavin biosynthesis protein n=1 Tax=Gulosibacter sediminis TaxID=1729695 RepID=A0ABY4MZS8_9MICO|nr:bifunctional riboflavin kinase/FAD synthetase [Gulosibacter sediminis]UQN15946.1 bifunctional riboflavin kinase/FAD synthetase [Gulosibacter sediminis]
MILVNDPASFPAPLRPSVVTIGKFDGLHCGHRDLIACVREESLARGLTSVVVTFDRHPAALFAPERAPKPVVSLLQKEELLADSGVDATVVVPFTREFSQMSPADFVENFLIEQLGMRAVVLGNDFRFGFKGAGDVAYLRERGSELGFDTIVIDDTSDDGTHRASSTRIRELLEEGDVRGAATALDRNHRVRGVVVHGAKRGRELGFPTANLGPETLEGYVPADGVYAGWLLVDGERLPAAISIGNNPTFEGVPQKQIEAYVLDATLDLYGKSVTVEFVDFIRPMLKFDSLEALIASLGDDVARTRELLS